MFARRFNAREGDAGVKYYPRNFSAKMPSVAAEKSYDIVSLT